jgi:hypothetical protein
MKCFIFGAGATANCDIANPDRRPPMVRTADFLRIVGKPLNGTLASSDYAERFLNPFCVWAFQRFDNLEYLFTLLFMLSLEDSFENIEAKFRGKYTNESWLDDAVLVAGKLQFATVPQNIITDLIGLVKDEIQLCLGTTGPHPSRYEFQPLSIQHRQLVRVLKPGDAVVSFNWDTVVDYALLNERLLNEASFQNPSFTTIRMPDDCKIVGGTPVFLLKPHGSFNWFSTLATWSEPEKIGVFFGKLHEGTDFMTNPPVILPYHSKELILQRLPVFKDEIHLTYQALADCDELVVIGKQFMTGDADLADSIKQSCEYRRRRVVYVNPQVKDSAWVKHHAAVFNATNTDQPKRLFSDIDSYINLL